jgi:hypothetical protein
VLLVHAEVLCFYQHALHAVLPVLARHACRLLSLLLVCC